MTTKPRESRTAKWLTILVTAAICGAIIWWATVAITKIYRIEYADAKDQSASMENHQSAAFKKLQLDHTAIVINGEIEDFRVENGRWKARVSSNGGSVESVSRGIAFCVGPSGYFLTARHCVDGGEDIFLAPRDPKLLPADFEQCRARIIWQSSVEDDLALLKTDGLDFSPMRMAPEVPGSGTLVFSLGHRLAAGNVIDVKPSTPLAPTEGGAVDAVPVVFRLRNDIPLLMGDSGCPIVNEEGEVIGVGVSITKNIDLLQAFSLRGISQPALLSACLRRTSPDSVGMSLRTIKAAKPAPLN